MKTGEWEFRGETDDKPPFGIEHALETSGRAVGTAADREVPYERYLKEAKKIASRLKDSFLEERLMTTDRALIPFLYYT
jgi:hypothetical protein